MSHLEQRLQQDLTQISTTVASMAEKVETVLNNAVHALLTHNAQLAYATVLADHAINRKMRKIDHLCHRFIATHDLLAGRLRLISSIIRINIELERVGDYAVTICRESLSLSQPPTGLLGGELETIAADSIKMLHQAIKAFKAENADQAKTTMLMSQNLEYSLNTVYETLIDEQNQLDITRKDRFALFVVFNMLKRVADQAKNVCEEVVFAVTGESKPKKRYKILFLDQDNQCLAPLAVAIAQQHFPHSGVYHAACQQAARTHHPALAEFIAQHGIDQPLPPLQTLNLTAKQQADYYLIISLQGAVKQYIEKPAFHTVLQQWDLTAPSADLDESQNQQLLEEAYRALSLNIRDLMETLHGKGAK
jgi:phosphate transport system protein